VDEDRQQRGGGRGDALSSPAGADPDPAPECLPPSLRRRLDRCADDWLSECAAQRGEQYARPAKRGNTLPWMVAAVATAIAVLGWWPRLTEFQAGVAAAGGFDQWRAERARARLLATAGAGHWAWGGASEMASGDVVWDARTQRGFLRLHGFVPNDPERAQYQLWIFDAARDDRYPVDGGVFDVPPGRDELIVPMHPTLAVSRPVAFAITVEQSGGVVVSSREKVVAFAQAGS
jgi:anti-sigma-K factor RskA